MKNAFAENRIIKKTFPQVLPYGNVFFYLLISNL